MYSLFCVSVGVDVFRLSLKRDGIAAGTSIASSGTVTIGNATLAVNLKSGETFGNTTIDNGLIETVATGTNTLSGAINGSGALVQVGTGLTVLTGADTYTGSTTVLHGTLQIGNGLTGSISGVSPVTITTGAQPALVLGTFIPALSNGATLRSTWPMAASSPITSRTTAC
jgi:autotransporter-associated beta strand protein